MAIVLSHQPAYRQGAQCANLFTWSTVRPWGCCRAAPDILAMTHVGPVCSAHCMGGLLDFRRDDSAWLLQRDTSGGAEFWHTVWVLRQWVWVRSASIARAFRCHGLHMGGGSIGLGPRLRPSEKEQHETQPYVQQCADQCFKHAAMRIFLARLIDPRTSESSVPYPCDV